MEFINNINVDAALRVRDGGKVSVMSGATAKVQENQKRCETGRKVRTLSIGQRHQAHNRRQYICNR